MHLFNEFERYRPITNLDSFINVTGMSMEPGDLLLLRPANISTTSCSSVGRKIIEDIRRFPKNFLKPCSAVLFTLALNFLPIVTKCSFILLQMLSGHSIDFIPILIDCGIAVVLRFGLRSNLLITFQVSDVLPFASLNKFSK